MYPTRLLRRVTHYIWECFRQRGEMKIRLKNHKGDELHVEEVVEELRVGVRYFAKQPSGGLVKQVDVVCFILRHGEWVPLELGNEGTPTVYGTSDPETGHVVILDEQGQLGAALFCDAWALRFLEEGFLASAAKLNPLSVKPTPRPQWPTPTVPAPNLETLEEWMWEDNGCEATDGCWVEWDACCPHNHPSWLLRLGLV